MNALTLGFIGLGIMGLPMAQNAKAKGYSVVGTTRSKSKRDRAKRSGIETLESPVDVAKKSDAVITMVTDAKAVQSVLEGKRGVFGGAVKGKTLIQMSTIDEPSTRKIYEASKKKGLFFLDCPVAGSKKQVEAGELILLAGGDLKLIDKWRKPLLSMGKAIVHAGPVGKGTALKLCMNLIVAQMTTALCESVALSAAQGLQPEKIFEVITHSPALNCGYFQIKQKALLQKDYRPAFSLENMLKDVKFMDQTADRSQLNLPVTKAVRELMEKASKKGWGSQDLSVMAKALMPNKHHN